MMNRTSNAFRSSPSYGDAPIDARQLAVLLIGVLASIAAGVGAFIFLSATHPAPNRLSWSLEPPRSHKVVARVLAAAEVYAAGRAQHRRVRTL